MKKYEILFFVPVTMESEKIEQTQKQVKDAITKHEGKIISEEDFGKKKLSYTVKHTRHGYFVLIVFEADKNKIDAIKKELNLITEVVRYRLVAKEKVDVLPQPVERKEKEEAPAAPKPEPEPKKEEIKIDEKVDLKELDLKIDELLSDEEENL